MEVQKLPLTLIAPSPMNPRKTFDEVELQELSESIEKQGLYQPITVRPIKDIDGFAAKIGFTGIQPPHYEIVCGERRYRAFSAIDGRRDDLAFSMIPAIVREMSDEEAFEAMITENLQRKDVDPMEEAFAFGQLIERGKTAEEVAARFGKSIRFVQDRIKLNNLIPELMLAVREDKMPIVAAMMIAKLDEDSQRLFRSQYEHNYHGYSKRSAEGFINNLFMSLDKSVWHKNGDSGFTGGCGRKCSECSLNTANHGCLFWEMNVQGSGRCTDRGKFTEKGLAFILDSVEKRADELVKRGQPLEFGKTVLVAMNARHASGKEKETYSRLMAALEKRGFEVVDPTGTFSHLVSYSNDDERVEEFLKEGKAYRCLSVFGYGGAELKDCRYYVRRDDTSVNSDGDGVPLEVTQILKKLAYEEETIHASYAIAGINALASCKPSTEPLLDDERVLMLAMMLYDSPETRKAIGMNPTSSPVEIRDYVASNREVWAQVMHSWIFMRMKHNDAFLSMGESALDDFGKVYCPDEYQKAKDRVLSKHEKSRSQAEKRLHELGYGLDGKKLPDENIAEKMARQLKAMKAKHKDAVILFRVGDFYECFEEDAEAVSKELGITVTESRGRKLAGFPHHALDTYLPKLVRAGVRVAIAEQLEEPKR